MIYTRKRTKKHLKRKAKKEKIKLLTSGDFEHINHIETYLKIPGPKILGMGSSKTRKSLLNWIQKIRQLTLLQNQKVHINFSESTKAQAFGVVRMLAQLSYIVNKKGKGIIRGTLPKDPVTAQVFQQTGLSDILGIKTQTTITHKDVKYWHHVSGSLIEGDKAGHLIKELAEKYGLNEEATANLYNGVTEAITNTIMHAYHEGSEESLIDSTKWWLFTGIKDDMLHFIVCDIGMGIPRSLQDERKHQGIIDLVKKTLTHGGHSKLIEFAMESGRSKTRKAHRGLGMAELKKFITSIGQGRLVIMSSRGVCSYQAQDGQLNLKTRNHRTSIMGTTIGWSVPMDAFEQTTSQ